MLRESIEKFIEYLPSPTSELALAAILVYTFLFSVERHGAASQSEGLTRWVQGADNRTWAHHYSLFLDHVFGGRSISWRCFIRSSIVSIVSVGLIYIVMYSAVDLSPDRVRDPFVFWKYIALAIFFNLIPDYLSLLETRWLIRQLDRITSVLGNVAALIVDVLCSAIIGALWIVLVSYLGGFSTSPIELVLVFSKLSVFFYSGFLASFFAIATWVTLSAMRLTSRTAIGKWLEMDRRPIEHRRLFFSGIVLVTGLLVGPLLVRDGETGLNQIEDLSCILVSDHVCSHNIRILPGDRAEPYVERLCSGLTKQECVPFFALLRPIFVHACENREPDSCWKLGIIYREGYGVERNAKMAVDHFSKSCDMGDAYGCDRLGAAYLLGDGVAKDLEQAAAEFKKGCKSDIGESCQGLAYIYFQRNDRDDRKEEIVQLFRKACELGRPEGCNHTGNLYEKGFGVTRDLMEAMKYYKRACAYAHKVACDNLLKMCNQHGRVSACEFLRLGGIGSGLELVPKQGPKTLGTIGAIVLFGFVAGVHCWIRRSRRVKGRSE